MQTIKRDRNKVTIAISANGYDWIFAHERSTEADAHNLETLIRQAFEKEEREIDAELADARYERDEAQRSINSLKGVITRLRRGRAKEGAP